MLDENLPTFHFRTSSDNPQSPVLYFTQNGSDPAPEYVAKKADPSTNPASRSKYAAALTDPFGSGVVYAEVLIEPEWQQQTLSAAEVRAQNGVAAAPVPVVPDNFTIQLYNPDQRIPVKMVPGSWNKSDSWEFEMPTQSFKMPSSSQLDRQNNDDVVRDITPKIMFKWKRDGRLSKDMTCYNVGRSLGKHKSKEPDITVALFKQARESAVTIYEPNLQRVEVEDRKGLDIVLVLGAEVIRDLYLVPRPDPFNISGASAAGAAAAASGRRQNSRPTAAPSPPIAAMSGAIGGASNIPPPQPPRTHSASAIPPSSTPEVDAETKRIQAMVEREERERDRRDREEQKRIKKMLEVEDKERRRKEAEVEKETERLRKKYGVEGQNLPAPRPNGPSPALPPRPGPGPQVSFASPPPQHLGPPAPWFAPPPQRPVSAGPTPGPFNNSTVNSWWRGPGGGGVQALPPPQQQQPNGRRRGGSGPYMQNAAASASGFFHRDRSEDDRRKVQKKRSVHF